LYKTAIGSKIAIIFLKYFSVMNNKLNFPAIQNYSKDYAAKLCDEFFSRNEVITGKKIMNLSNINQVNLFSIKQLSEKWQEETVNIKSPFFDYEHEDVQKSLGVLMNTLSQHIAVRREHFEPILKDATQSTLMLLLNPIDYFGNQFRDLPNFMVYPKDLKKIEKFTQINKIVPNVIIDKINAAGVEFVYVNSALKWLEEIPEIGFDQAERYLSLLSEKVPVTIKDFYGVERHQDIVADIHAKVAVDAKEEAQATASFFEDFEIAEQPLPTISHATISSEIPAVAGVQAEAAPIELTPFTFEPEKTETPIVEHEVFLVDQPKSFVFEPLPSHQKQEDLTLNGQFQTSKNLNDDTQTSETLQDSQSKSKIEGILSVISLNQRYLFINRLFSQSGESFQHAIDELELCKDYSEAKELMLKKYVTKFNWDVTSNEAEEFFEILKRRFA
jgi:hypothetical protein